MKTKSDIFKMLADADISAGTNPNSFTLLELMAADPLKRQRSAWKDIARKMVAAGRWEKAMKFVDKKRQPSYVKIK